MSVNEKMTAIANQVRTLSGVDHKLGLDEMASHTKDANTEVDTQEVLIQQIANALQGKTAPSEDLDAVLTEQEELIATLQDTLRGKAQGSGEAVEPIIEPLEVTGNGTYTAPENVHGYSPVTVNVPIPDGYIVPDGTKEISENGTHDVKEFASVDVNVPIPDGYIVPNGELEVTENGKHDVTEYSSVNVNVPTGGGGDDLAELLTNKMTALNSDVTSIRQYAFRGATALVSVNLPKATSIATNSFYGCTKLTDVNMPLVKTIASNAFNGCSIIPSIVLPSLTSGSEYMFRYCYLLKTIDLPVITKIVANMFYDCRRLTAVILRSETMCTLAATSAFTNCNHLTGTVNSTYNPNGDKDCYIYVPSALIDEYKAATNWSTYSSQFRAIEDYPEICGGES